MAGVPAHGPLLSRRDCARLLASQVWTPLDVMPNLHPSQGPRPLKPDQALGEPSGPFKKDLGLTGRSSELLRT